MREGAVGFGARWNAIHGARRMRTIDGAQGEGGGQILRTALALSLVTGQPFRLERIRAGRTRPGLLAQHLAAVDAASAVGRAEARGAVLGSEVLEFQPGSVVPGEYHLAVRTAGSATLVLQTILPPLLTAAAPSRLVLEGGTHNPFAPPFDFLAHTFAPAIRRMGPHLELELERPGFFPAGGGRFRARLEPAARLSRLDWLDRGAVRRRGARAIVSKLPASVGERELAEVRTRLGWTVEESRVESVRDPTGPGNALLLEIETEHGTTVFAAFGERGRSAEEVGREVAGAAAAWLRADVPVDEHLADQLLIPMALAGGGSFRTTRPTLHTTTNAGIIQQFLSMPIRWEPESADTWRVTVGR